MSRRPPRTKAGKKAKVMKVMHEYMNEQLKTSAGKKVKSRKQAIAIAISEARMSRK